MTQDQQTAGQRIDELHGAQARLLVEIDELERQIAPLERKLALLQERQYEIHRELRQLALGPRDSG